MSVAPPATSALSFGQLQALWTQAVQNVLGQNSGYEALAPIMAEVATLESGGVPSATNPNDNGGTQTSWGLWQISNGDHSAPAGWSDPLTNAELAVQKLASQGPGAWPTTFPQALQNLGLPAQAAGVQASIATAQTPEPPAWAANAIVVVTVLLLAFVLFGAWRRS